MSQHRPKARNNKQSSVNDTNIAALDTAIFYTQTVFLTVTTLTETHIQ